MADYSTSGLGRASRLSSRVGGDLAATAPLATWAVDRGRAPTGQSRSLEADAWFEMVAISNHSTVFAVPYKGATDARNG